MLCWIYIPEKLWLFLCMCALCSGNTVWFYIIFRAPSWGSGVLSHVCIYVTGLIQAVLFYLRVVVLCSVGVECSGSVCRQWGGGGGRIV